MVLRKRRGCSRTRASACAGIKTSYRSEVNGVSVTCLSVTEWDFHHRRSGRACGGGARKLRSAARHDPLGRGAGVRGDGYAKSPTGGHSIDAGRGPRARQPFACRGRHRACIEGKYIVYGLGNFCFGGNANPERQGFHDLPTDVHHHGGRWKRLTDAGITIIPCSVLLQDRAKTTTVRRRFPARRPKRVLRKIAGYSDVDQDSRSSGRRRCSSISRSWTKGKKDGGNGEGTTLALPPKGHVPLESMPGDEKSRDPMKLGTRL